MTTKSTSGDEAMPQDEATGTRSPSAVGILCDAMRRKIMDGDLPPGTRLIEADLTRAFGVSRGPVREALRRLEAEGLVEREAHRGAVVRGLARHEVAEIFDVRAVLEGRAAALAAIGAAEDKDGRAWLRSAVKTWGRQALHRDPVEHTKENKTFHTGIMDIAGNETLRRQIGQLEIPGYLRVFMPMLTAQDLQDSCRDHVEIASAILEQDADCARDAMERHVRRTGQRALELFPEDVFSAPDRMSPVLMILGRTARPQPPSAGPGGAGTPKRGKAA